MRICSKVFKIFSKVSINGCLSESFGNINWSYHLGRKISQRSDLATTRRGLGLKTMKLETPHFNSLFTPELEHLIGIFKKYDHELRIAGGAVRDLMMGKQPEDIDLATTATPDEMNRIFSDEGIRVINTRGEKHGTVTARINDKENFEVTTLRIDLVTDGRRAEVLFTKDWELDANRRDLTVNSLFLGFDGTVYDYFNGIEDLKKRRIAFVGDPTTRICEDYLRILRYFRFYGRLADDPDNHELQTLEAIQKHADGLARISGERIWSELRKILTGNHVGYLIPRMLQTGLAEYIGLPSTCNVDNFKSVFEKCKHMNPQPMTLLAALLNNEKEMMQLHARQKFSAYERDLGLFVVTNRGDKPHAIPMRPYQILLVESIHQRKHVQEWICEIFKYRGDEKMLEEFLLWQPPKFPINGYMLREKGVKTGKHYTLILKKLREIWAEHDFDMTEEKLLSHLESVIKELGIK